VKLRFAFRLPVDYNFEIWSKWKLSFVAFCAFELIVNTGGIHFGVWGIATQLSSENSFVTGFTHCVGEIKVY
jgi:hypothetical protein